MLTECVKEAASVAEAVDAALEELGVQQDAVEYEVLEEPGHKVFGIGLRPERQGARLAEAVVRGLARSCGERRAPRTRKPTSRFPRSSALDAHGRTQRRGARQGRRRRCRGAADHSRSLRDRGQQHRGVRGRRGRDHPRCRRRRSRTAHRATRAHARCTAGAGLGHHEPASSGSDTRSSWMSRAIGIAVARRSRTSHAGPRIVHRVSTSPCDCGR